MHSPAHTLPIGRLANQRIGARSRIAFQATRPADQTARRTRVSVFVICHNEVDRIEACLQSVVGWADELVVLDSGSTDGTLELVRRYTSELLQTDWPGFGVQRNRALQHVTGDWVFSLDADERLTPALRDEIDRVLDDPTLRATLLMVPWRTYFFGRPLRFGRYASPQGKLFKRDGARYREHQVHESLVLPVHQQALLKSPLLHHSWRGYEHVQTKHLKYACLLAQQKNAQGLHGSLAYASLRFFTDFFQQFVLRGGFIDGWRGFLMAVLLGQYAFHKYAALAVMRVGDRTGGDAGGDPRQDPKDHASGDARDDSKAGPTERAADHAPLPADARTQP